MYVARLLLSLPLSLPPSFLGVGAARRKPGHYLQSGPARRRGKKESEKADKDGEESVRTVLLILCSSFLLTSYLSFVLSPLPLYGTSSLSGYAPRNLLLFGFSTALFARLFFLLYVCTLLSSSPTAAVASVCLSQQS